MAVVMTEVTLMDEARGEVMEGARMVVNVVGMSVYVGVGVNELPVS